MSHTPGPWTQDAADDYVGADGSIVAMTLLNDYTGTVGVSCIFTKPEDKQLAFSAPDLLAALEAVVMVADRNTVEFDMARAAIAKAKGKA